MDEVTQASGPRLLAFSVGGRRFAVPLTSVREIVPVGAVTRLPGAPRAVLGIANVRGQVLTVVDLGVRLSGAAVDRDEGAILLVESGGRTVGAVVQALHDVLVPEGGIAAPAASGEADALVAGVVSTSDGVAVVLDVPALVRETLVVTGGDW